MTAMDVFASKIDAHAEAEPPDAVSDGVLYQVTTDGCGTIFLLNVLGQQLAVIDVRELEGVALAREVSAQVGHAIFEDVATYD